MRVAFRVDASSKIGSGHFMRCLTLADGLRQHCLKIRFIVRHLPEHFRSILAQRGYEISLLQGSWPESQFDNWLGVSQMQDALDSIKALSDSHWDWLIVDQYALDIHWESMLRLAVKRILVIDDLANRSHDCNILLDQNYFEDADHRYTGKVDEHCRLLLGPQYVLLREEFQYVRKQVKERSGDVRHLLVSFGGVDADDNTSLVIEALRNLGLAISVDVVIGAQHPFAKKIKLDCADLGFNCHEQISCISDLMLRADLAIGACGFTCYELAVMQVPSILIPVTDIQASVARRLYKKGVIHMLILKDEYKVQAISDALIEVLKSNERRESMSIACGDFIDTEGVSRVVKELYFPINHGA